jgi:hypothetical protein
MPSRVVHRLHPPPTFLSPQSGAPFAPTRSPWNLHSESPSALRVAHHLPATCIHSPPSCTTHTIRQRLFAGPDLCITPVNSYPSPSKVVHHLYRSYHSGSPEWRAVHLPACHLHEVVHHTNPQQRILVVPRRVHHSPVSCIPVAPQWCTTCTNDSHR